jgi:hypothetical protein
VNGYVAICECIQTIGAMPLTCAQLLSVRRSITFRQALREPFTAFSALGRRDTLRQLSMNWWITTTDRIPLGPVSAELLLEGIEAGRVTPDALVCEVGGTTWKSIGDIGLFAAALARLERARRFAPDLEHVETSSMGSAEDFDDPLERTIVERSPLFASEPPAGILHGSDDSDEKTIVDQAPLRRSELP